MPSRVKCGIRSTSAIVPGFGPTCSCAVLFLPAVQHELEFVLRERLFPALVLPLSQMHLWRGRHLGFFFF